MIPYLLTAGDDEEARARGVADVGSLQVAQVYAEALLNAAEKAGKAAEVLAELEALLQTSERPRTDLRNFLAGGVVGRVTRAAVIRKAFDGRAEPMLVDFLLVLNDHDRLTLLPAILFEALQLRDRRARRLPVTVRVAVPLSDEQTERIRRTVSERLNVEAAVNVQVEPELLGGIILRVGDWVFDGTVRTKLEQIRDQILSRGSYEIQSGRDRFSSRNGD
jgi:F-type H+-transporting ATPase subunit delta